MCAFRPIYDAFCRFLSAFCRIEIRLRPILFAAHWCRAQLFEAQHLATRFIKATKMRDRKIADRKMGDENGPWLDMLVIHFSVFPALDPWCPGWPTVWVAGHSPHFSRQNEPPRRGGRGENHLMSPAADPGRMHTVGHRRRSVFYSATSAPPVSSLQPAALNKPHRRAGARCPRALGMGCRRFHQLSGLLRTVTGLDTISKSGTLGPSLGGSVAGGSRGTFGRWLSRVKARIPLFAERCGAGLSPLPPRSPAKGTDPASSRLRAQAQRTNATLKPTLRP